jgi:predicted DCC family thiol-disulfide oxidoreductase YuxK
VIKRNTENIILFDGFCNLCKGIINFIKKRDKKTKFLFITLQSESGHTLLNKFGLPEEDLNSVVYISSGKYFLRSTAILHILKDLGGFWKLFFLFIIIPGFIRDSIYKIISKMRYGSFCRTTPVSNKHI